MKTMKISKSTKWAFAAGVIAVAAPMPATAVATGPAVHCASGGYEETGGRLSGYNCTVDGRRVEFPGTFAYTDVEFALGSMTRPNQWFGAAKHVRLHCANVEGRSVVAHGTGCTFVDLGMSG
ncbi:hypothetical protein [Yinghuangia soli]|uniref:Secreted protein n=1 Tax=Yinghuangia soli TaxID=2908204 RepID=A0AA41Q3F8_9ACTN|nr:hypothetical protein [Yinghuangia soli]MCF2530838.1 hypothetical protein [Yinghuangia soli]